MSMADNSEEYERFTEALERVLSVSHEEIKRREAADQMKREFTGKKRKPKPKGASASSGHASRKGG